MILSWVEARLLSEKCRKAGGIVVSTNGCFDILHAGHVSLLHQARQLGDLLIVGINSDESVKKIKGPSRPINEQTARAQVLSALRAVDGVCIFSEENPVCWLKEIRPHIHVKGGDWDPLKMPESSVLLEWGARVQCLPFLEGYSTTQTLKKVKERHSL